MTTAGRDVDRRRRRPTSPSAGVRSISSCLARRRSWAAKISGPYSTNVPSSTRSSRFSRAVRWPRSWRLATASGRAASRPSAWRSRTASRSSRSRRRDRPASSARAPSCRASRRRLEDREQLALGHGVADARRRPAARRRRARRPPRAPSSSPRARSPRCRRRPARRRSWAIAITVRVERRDHLELLRVRHRLRARQPTRAPPRGSPRARRCRWRPAPCATRRRSRRCAISIAPPSCAGWPSVLDCTRPVFAVGRERLRDDLRTEQLAERRDLGAGGLVAGPRLVGEHGQLDPLAAAEVGRVARGQLADQDQVDAGRLELLTGAMQLHRVGLAIDSAVVAQPDQHRGAVAPQVAEPGLVAVLVGEHDVGERRRRWPGARSAAWLDDMPSIRRARLLRNTPGDDRPRASLDAISRAGAARDSDALPGVGRAQARADVRALRGPVALVGDGHRRVLVLDRRVLRSATRGVAVGCARQSLDAGR